LNCGRLERWKNGRKRLKDRKGKKLEEWKDGRKGRKGAFYGSERVGGADEAIYLNDCQSGCLFAEE